MDDSFPYGRNVSDNEALAVLHGTKNSKSIREIAKVLMCSPPRVLSIMRELEDNGLIVSVPKKHRARVLTRNGHDALSKLMGGGGLGD